MVREALLSKPLLVVAEDVVLFKVLYGAVVNDVFHACYRERAVIYT